MSSSQRPPWKGGAVSLPRSRQKEITPKIGSENRHNEQPLPLAHLHMDSGVNTRDNYKIPSCYANNPHFPGASGRLQREGEGWCNQNGILADRMSKKVWEENTSREAYWGSRQRILRLLEKDKQALKDKQRRNTNEIGASSQDWNRIWNLYGQPIYIARGPLKIDSYSTTAQ